MLIRVSFMVFASVAALKISQTRRNANKESDDSHLEHESEERENSITNSNHVVQNEEDKQMKIEMPQNLLTGEFEDCQLLRCGEKMDYATEKELLQNLIQKYREREVNLERKLVELNSVKEEQSAIAQIQRELEKKAAKLDSLKKTIASLQSENKSFQEKIREDVLCKAELEIANKIIDEMQRKRDVNGCHVNDHILMLQEQVVELQKYNGSGRDVMVNKKFEEAQEMELEVLELKRRNKEVELEKREMGIKLAAAQARVRTEEEIVAQIQEEITGLLHVHEELSEQVERLQRNRFTMVQELVYQRWLYTCLRFEVHNHQKQIRKASRQDLSRNSSEELYEKTHHALTSDSELDIISSNESDEIETTTLESSSSSQTSISSKKSSLISKLKRWKKTKDYNNRRILSKGGNSPSRLIRRFSMSMVESDLSKPRNSDGDSPIMSLDKPITRLNRVSFSDSVKPSTYKDMPEVAEDVTDDKEINSGHNMDLTSTITSSDEHEAGESDELCKSNEYVVGNPIKNDSPVENEGIRNQNVHSDELYSKNELVGRMHDRTKRQLVQLLAFFFFSLILLLAYFRIK